MKIRRDEYLSYLPAVLMAGVSALCVGAARWLRGFDDDRPDLGD